MASRKALEAAAKKLGQKAAQPEASGSTKKRARAKTKLGPVTREDLENLANQLVELFGRQVTEAQYELREEMKRAVGALRAQAEDRDLGGYRLAHQLLDELERRERQGL